MVIFRLFKKKYKFVRIYKSKSYIFLTFVLIIPFVFIFQHSFSASAVGTASAEILANIVVSQTAELNFGRILPDATGGSVFIAKNSDAANCTNSFCSGPSSRGKFIITGSDGNVDITYSNAVLSNGSETMEVMIDDPLINDYTVTITGGTAILNVGGILTITANQAPGVYNTSSTNGSGYNVNVNY